MENAITLVMVQEFLKAIAFWAFIANKGTERKIYMDSCAYWG